MRIRSLESECGRLLSDNLTLNGRILELEKELEECKGAQSIADHALEIRDKMEAQLVQWGAMIQGLGIEPVAKRQATTSPGGRRIARPRKSGGFSPAARRRPRDSRNAEAAAAQEEGRLPPIHENKTYPRRTMRYVVGISKQGLQFKLTTVIAMPNLWLYVPKLRRLTTLRTWVHHPHHDLSRMNQSKLTVPVDRPACSSLVLRSKARYYRSLTHSNSLNSSPRRDPCQQRRLLRRKTPDLQKPSMFQLVNF